MIGRLKNIFLILATPVILSACSVFAYQGSLLSKEEIEEMRNKNNYHAKEANAIIDYNLKKKKKRTRLQEKDRKDQQEYLEALNKNMNKAKKVRQPVPVNFY